MVSKPPVYWCTKAYIIYITKYVTTDEIPLVKTWCLGSTCPVCLSLTMVE